MATQSKNSRTSEVMALITGMGKRYPNGSQQLAFGGTTRTVTATTQLLQSFVDLRQAVIVAQAAARTKVAAERAQGPALLLFIEELVAFIKVTFGNQPDVLSDFGLAPRKVPTPPTAEQKAVAAAKRLATRKARGTMGPKAKKGVKGNVTATLVVTPAAPAEAPAQPAATPPTLPTKS
jgi:hypothetical protein